MPDGAGSVARVGSITSDNGADRLARILASVPDPEHRAVLARWRDHRLAAGKTPGTVGNELTILRGFCNRLPRRPRKVLGKAGSVTRADVERYLADRTSQRTWASRRADGSLATTEGAEKRIADSTHHLRFNVLRPFFSWLRDSPPGELPPEVRGIKVKRPKVRVPMDRVPTPERLQRLLAANTTAQEQAALTCLFESGLRAGEFVSLRFGDVELHGDGTAHLHLPSHARGLKTGRRDVLLADCVPHLERWLREHPRHGDAAAPLWSNQWGHALNPPTLYGWLRRMELKAGFTTHASPHMFRHGSATWAATLGLSEPAMRARFGWSESSSMAARYVHASGRDYEHLYREKLGIAAPRERGRAVPPRLCLKCKHPNVPTAHFCAREGCGAPLSDEARTSIERLRGEEARVAERDRLKSVVADLLLEVLGAGNNDAKLDAPAARLLALLENRGNLAKAEAQRP